MPQSVAEATISTEGPTALKKKVARLVNKPALNFFELAHALAELHATNAEEFASLPAVKGKTRRRMYYLLEVGKLLRDEGISREVAETIRWTKLQIVARHLYGTDEPSPFTVAELLDLASKHKARDLPTAIDSKRIIPRRVAQFYLSTGARAELNEALLSHGAKQKGKRLTGKEAALIRLVRAVSAKVPAQG